MIKTKTNIRTYLVLSLICLLPAISASAQTKQEIVAAWQQQVKSFQTLQLDYEATAYDSVEPLGADAISELKYQFALSGDNYYSYLKFTGEGDFSAMASAYDGAYYQKLTDEKIGVTVYRTKIEDNSQQPYLGDNPLTLQYQFAFIPDAPHTIGTLKKPETWERLIQRITAIQPSMRNGEEGFTVAIESPQDRRIYKVFVDKTLWPRHFSFVDHSGQDEAEENAEAGDMDVNVDINVTISVGKNEAILRFPNQISFQGLVNRKLVMQGSINTVPESLKINEPVPEDLFTLAPKDAVFVDVDKQRQKFEERQHQ